MNQINQTAIGTVVSDAVLTIVIRRGDLIEEPRQFPIFSALDAAALLLAQRRNQAPIYIEASGSAAQVLEEIKKRYSDSRDEIVNGMSPANSAASGQVLFANRRSELFFNFRELLGQGKLSMPAIYNEQIAAFGYEERNGKIFFLPPDEVAAKLGKYPVFALAAVLAAIETPDKFEGPVLRAGHPGHDPLAMFEEKKK